MSPDVAKEFPAMTVRRAELGDAIAIYDLIRANPNELIVRPLGDIVRNIDRFTVLYVDGELVGCSSFTIWLMPQEGDFSKATIELTSVAIRSDLRGRGLGRIIVSTVLERVLPLRPTQVIVLTFTPEFFRKMGFQKISKQEIMHKIYLGCVNCTKYTNPFTCPEVAMAYIFP